MESNIRYIPLGQVYAQNNNREYFDPDKLQQLALSIYANGLIQPVTVKKTDKGFLLVAGERRTRASQWLIDNGYHGAGLCTILANITTADDRQAYLMTLEENDNREATSPIEQANGYRRFITELGGNISELAKATGRTLPYIERRLALLELSPNVRELVAKKQVGLTYAEAMAHLDHNRQNVALRQLRDNPDPNLKWFTEVVRRLYAQQLQDQQTSLFSFDTIPTKQPETEQPIVKLPADPDSYRPEFNPANMLADCTLQLERWTNAAASWRQLGYDSKAKQCDSIASVLSALVATLPGVKPDQDAKSKIMRILVSGESYTTGQIYRLANVAKAEARPALFELISLGQVTELPAGRGKRYQLSS